MATEESRVGQGHSGLTTHIEEFGLDPQFGWKFQKARFEFAKITGLGWMPESSDGGRLRGPGKGR